MHCANATRQRLARGVACAAAGALAMFACGSAQAAKTLIDPARISQHVKVLSGDEFEGRGPATPAAAKLIDYVPGQFNPLARQPAGPHGARTPDVPLAPSPPTRPPQWGRGRPDFGHGRTDRDRLAATRTRTSRQE